MTPDEPLAEEKPLPSLRFETAAYRSDGGCPVSGALLLLGLALGGGLALGFAASFIRQWFYLVLLFPICIGVGLGAVSIFGINLGKVRNTFLAGLAGLVGACVAMPSMHYFDYQRLLKKVDEQIPGAQAVVMERFGFWDYMDAQARQGVTLGRARGANRKGGLNLGYYGSIAYWTAELFIVAGLAYFMARGSAADPFCTQCNCWKDERTLGRLPLSADAAVALVQAGEIGALAAHLPAAETGQVQVKMALCPRCGPEAPVDVALEHIATNAKGEEQTRELTRVTYPGEAAKVFETLFAGGGAAVEPSDEPAPDPDEQGA